MENDYEDIPGAQSSAASDISKLSTLATASVALGILSFVGLGPLCSVPGIVIGHLARRRARNCPNEVASRSRAAAGLGWSYTNLVLFILVIWILLPELRVAQESALRASCQGGLKEFGFAFDRFAQDDADHQFPELSARAGILTIENEAPGMKPFYPTYLPSTSLLTCPDDMRAMPRDGKGDPRESREAFEHSSYIYIGYVVTNESELKAFAQAYKDRIAKGLRFDTDLDVRSGTGTVGGDKILRLREHIERYIIRDLGNPAITPVGQNAIPVLWESFEVEGDDSVSRFRHQPNGANVLFMDGHVEFIKYPGKFPVTEEACRILSELHDMRANPPDRK